MFAAPAPSAVSAAAKKGVDVWSFDGVDTALARSGARWYLDWSTSPGSIASQPGIHFVPMIHDASDVTTTRVAEAERHGPDLLTFNEPDLSSQANLTVAEALALWPRLEATHLALASPAVAYGADRVGGWLDRFMRGAARRHYRVNFIALHWYGADFRTSDAVGELRAYLTAVHERYPSLKIWLTEYSLINFDGAPRYPTDSEQATFISASVAMLDSLRFVARFAWFALPSSGAPGTGLFDPGATPTAAGEAFSNAP